MSGRAIRAVLVAEVEQCAQDSSRDSESRLSSFSAYFYSIICFARQRDNLNPFIELNVTLEGGLYETSRAKLCSIDLKFVYVLRPPVNISPT